MKKRFSLIALLLAISVLLSGCTLPFRPLNQDSHFPTESPDTQEQGFSNITLDSIPAFDGKTPYVEINGNTPFFTSEEITEISYESYSDLDALGRCGVAIASVGVDLMPTEERGSISGVKPSGWHTVKYDIVNTKYLYNRCHLIGYQLTGENANVENLITGTRYLNVDGMLPFENMVADYVKESENHVMYRVTPIFVGSELVARGVLMEAMSVEDGGEDISFCVYVYNCQPGITIDYNTGKSHLNTAPPEDIPEDDSSELTGPREIAGVFVLNASTETIHKESCRSISQMSEKNKILYTGLYSDLISDGYNPCGNCKPCEIFDENKS